MTSIPYRTYHGSGNDFAVIDADAHTVPDRSGFATSLCDELDTDGVLFLRLDEAADPSRVEIRLFQPDGSTAAMCGNGARVAGRWAAERTGDRTFVLDTGAGPRHVEVYEDFEVSVEMGRPRFSPEAVPLDRDEPLVETAVETITDGHIDGFEVTAVNTGVPHAVAFVEDVAAIDLEETAPPIRHAPVFPTGANVTVATAVSDGFDQRTYERGVEGETRACGTGAVAIAAVAERLGAIEPGDPVTVSPPGGDLIVAIRSDGTGTLRGPTAFEFAAVASVP
jgi:diaminopimelate epimerase